MEIGTVTGPLLNGIAGQLEALGFDIVLFADSQNRAPEVWTALGAAARETHSSLLGPGITNTVTRDPAVIASAASTLHKLTEGRAVLAIGRGDSSAHFIGKKPEKVDEFERKLVQIRDYLHSHTATRGGMDSPMDWLALTSQHGIVPIELAPSGPKMTTIAAKYADRISFAVGSNPEYIAQFVTHARQEITKAGRDPSTVKFGAWLNVVVHEDKQTALNAVRGTTGIWARFSTWRPDPGNMPSQMQEAIESMKNFSMSSHGDSEATGEDLLSNNFVDWFSIAGNVDYVKKRMLQLAELDLDYCYIVPGELGFADEVRHQSMATFAQEIIPFLRDL